jgi:hypothetical protein
MSILDYTSYDEVRAALGVSVSELSDDTLSLLMYEDALLADLDDIDDQLATTFATVQVEPTPTDAQTRFLRVTRLFATYSLAKALSATLPMFGPKSVEDGKARMERFADPYKATIASILAEYEKWRGRVQQAYIALGQSGTTATARPYFAVVSPASDPITGT